MDPLASTHRPQPTDPGDRPRKGGTIAGLPRSTAVPALAMMAAASVCYLLWWGLEARVGTDTIFYQEVARDLTDGSLGRLHDRTLGYPLVLLATASHETVGPALVIVQFVGHLAAAWMALVLATRFRLPRWAMLGLLALLLSPPLSEKAVTAMSEAPTEVLLLAAVLCLVRWGETSSLSHATAAGVLIAAAALVRPTYQLLGLAAAGGAFVWILRQRRWRDALRHGGALAAGSGLIIGSVVAYNFARFDYPGLSPLLGWNLCTKTVLFVDQLPADNPTRELLVTTRDQSLVSGSHTAAMYFWRIKDQVGEAVGLERPAIDNYMVRLNLGLIARNPLDYAVAVGTATSNYLTPADTDISTGGRRIVQFGYGLGHLVVLVGFAAQLFGMAGLYVSRRLKAAVGGPFADPAARRVWLFSLAVVAYSAAVSVTVEAGYARYRTPTDPLILVVAAGGVWMCRQALGKYGGGDGSPRPGSSGD